jgi:hypothetical protein
MLNKIKDAIRISTWNSTDIATHHAAYHIIDNSTKNVTLFPAYEVTYNITWNITNNAIYKELENV